MSAAADPANNPNVIGNNTFANINAALGITGRPTRRRAGNHNTGENSFSHLAHLTRNRPRPGNKTFKGNKGARARFSNNVTVHNRPRTENNNARRRHWKVITKQKQRSPSSSSGSAMYKMQHSEEDAYLMGKAAERNLAHGPEIIKEMKARESAIFKKAMTMEEITTDGDFINFRVDIGLTPPSSFSASGPRRKTTPSITLIYIDGSTKKFDIPITESEVRNQINVVESAERGKAQANYNAINSEIV
jgi:hypothetical protein